ncbi:uncharacterized protein LY89DRAFT_672642 [Mollisia scopiformis]|uniref:Uncharacterized protein n=1 Tax=Mollisia scopiformis TaxID=149040 RepID=A0A194WZQ6_MOLSC|nr:uncharacterized protein LY89DRAFT_672642 [Mollisia scopiformis]KUJ13428.1 hypothetical protein LY89DRAFT_672642 [Mollisia scopiformis]
MPRRAPDNDWTPSSRIKTKIAGHKIITRSSGKVTKATKPSKITKPKTTTEKVAEMVAKAAKPVKAKPKKTTKKVAKKVEAVKPVKAQPKTMAERFAEWKANPTIPKFSAVRNIKVVGARMEA